MALLRLSPADRTVASDVACWRLDVATLAVTGSPGLHALFGHAAEPPDDRQETLERHVAPEDRPALRQAWAAALQGEPLQLDLRVRRRDGRITWVRLLGRSDQPAGQPAQAVWGTAQDITDLRSTIDSAPELNARLRAMLELGNVGIAHVDVVSGRLLRANDRLCQLLQQPHGALAAVRYLSLTHPAERAAHAHGWKRLMRGDIAVYDSEARLRRRDGSPLAVLLSANLLRDDGGVPVMVAVAVVSVDERQRSERALAAREEQLRLGFAELEERSDELRTELAAAREALQREIAERRAAEQRVRELLGRHVQAIEDERSRISRELHDTLGQHLAALGIGLKMIDDLPGRPAAAHERLQQLREVLDRLEDQIDRLSFELRPPALDELGLEAALRSFVDGWSHDSGVEVDLHTHGLRTGRLASVVETTVYRVVQEALVNVRKHAGATRVGVIVERRLDELRTVVEDDGRGFDPAAVAPSGGRHWGLRSMAERALLVAGQLQVESSEGAGTTVYLSIPVPAGEQPEEHERE